MCVHPTFLTWRHPFKKPSWFSRCSEWSLSPPRTCLTAFSVNQQLLRSSVADPKILKRGGGVGRKTIYQLCPHLWQKRTTKYMPFRWKSGFLQKKYEPMSKFLHWSSHFVLQSILFRSEMLGGPRSCSDKGNVSSWTKWTFSRAQHEVRIASLNITCIHRKTVEVQYEQTATQIFYCHCIFNYCSITIIVVFCYH